MFTLMLNVVKLLKMFKPIKRVQLSKHNDLGSQVGSFDSLDLFYIDRKT